MTFRILFIIILLSFVNNSYSQKKDSLVSDTNRIHFEQKKSFFDHFKLTGYAQIQFQHGEENASLSVGSKNSSNAPFNRIGIRRGRIKLQAERGIALGVFQIDITEEGVGIKDLYVDITDPWLKSNSIRVGVFNRNFGNEIVFSSSRRLNPERSKVTTTLFPQERDMGAMLTLQAPKKSRWNPLKLELAVVAGNGDKLEIDNKKDFIGSFTYTKTFKNNFNFGTGFSYYYGKTHQGSANVYRMQGKSMVVTTDSSFIGQYAKREYFGVEALFSFKSRIGSTQIDCEYIFGTQPGAIDNSKSPNFSSLPTTDTYIRKFQGGYIYLYQSLGKLPLYLVLKYDFYDPNIQVKKNDIGLNGTSKGDVLFQRIGIGLTWDATSNLRIFAYYDFINNETSANLLNYNKDLKDNVFTLRLQYRF
ncbi:MAG TPA: hypothetical protein PKN38_00035 [Taishania sp.]|nr:hypothetical protein [Taishania sp.]